MNKMCMCTFLALLSLISPLYAEEHAAAKVNSAVITDLQLEQEVDQLIPRSTYHGTISESKRAEFRDKALENLIDKELQYQDAVAKGMKPGKKQVKEYLTKIREQYASKKDYKKALEQGGMTEDTLRLAVEKNVMVQQAIQKVVTEPSRMTEDSVREYYSKNAQQFIQPESIQLRLISCKDENKAKTAFSRVKSGEDFGTVAALMSEDNFRIKGGDVGSMHRGRLLQEIEDVAFALKIGEVGGPVQAGGIWYIIRLEDRQPERQVGFDETKSRLKQQLEAKREQELLAKWVSDLRSKAKIEIISSSPQ